MDITAISLVEDIRVQESLARYPELLVPASHDRQPEWRHERRIPGLITTILAQNALTPTQRRSLAALRLRQFILCDWYDATRVVADRLDGDPIVAELPPRSLHVIVGDTDSRLLAYTCLQPAGDQTNALAADDRDTLLTTPGRPLFPTERELFGPDVFTTVPGLSSVPLARVWEWACSFRNQALRTPLTAAAMYEVFCAPLLFALDPQHGVDVILGNTNLAARKVYKQLGVPGLFAPAFPAQPPEEDGYWTEGVNRQGEFWPSVLALDDMRRRHQHLRMIDAALDEQPQQLIGALRAALAETPVLPEVFLPPSGAAPSLWMSDPDALPDAL
jgi:hypothetical protein